MTKLLPKTWLSRFTLISFVVAILAAIGNRMAPGRGLGALFALALLLFFLFAGFTLLRWLMRKLVWRVRNRLIVTYLLAGAVPVLLIVSIGLVAFYILMGMSVSYFCQAEFNQRLAHLESTAMLRAKAIAEGRPSAADEDSIQILVRRNDAPASGPGPIPTIPTWSLPGFKGLIHRDRQTFFMGAHAQYGSGANLVEVFVYKIFDDAEIATLVPGITRIVMLRGIRSGNNIDVNSGPVLDSARLAPSAPPQFGASGTVPTMSFALDSGEGALYFITLTAQPRMVLGRLSEGLGMIGALVRGFLIFLAISFLLVELIAIASSAQLIRTLTRTVHDLSVGTKKVEGGDFSHRIPVRAKDQLSELAQSFNNMTERVERLIEDVKEKEKLESELEIARQVQFQLFPKGAPVLKTLELVGLCNPGRRVVSGDYYDFIPLNESSTALVIGDIAGKGISAALLMASIQSSLHAQLALETSGNVSTATLVSRLNRQLYANTASEKYATFYCGVYDDRSGNLVYTNAGHLPPVLIRDGKPLRLEATGTVIGMFAEAPYEQNSILLQPGDLLVAFTDGLTEAENAAGEEFGEKRLIQLLIEHVDKPLENIVQIVLEKVRSWAHDPDNQDDTTLLMARRLPL